MSSIQEAEKFENGLNSLLADYAAGHLSPALHGLVAGHLSLSMKNRAYVAALESLRAQEIAEALPAVLDRRDAILNRIFDSEPFAPMLNTAASDALLPDPVAVLVAQDMSSIKWRSVMPGLREYNLKNDRSSHASLLWINAGRTMPSHTHHGTEITLVLKGGFTDASGHYSRGDIAIADADIDHRPRADEGDDCICFVVNDAALKLTCPVARFFNHLTGH